MVLEVASNRVGTERIDGSAIDFYGSSFVADATGRKPAEGARSVYEAAEAYRSDQTIRVVIPPRQDVQPSRTAATTSTQRNRNIQSIQENRRSSWQKSSGFNRRSLVEKAIYRYKTIVGRGLRARSLPINEPRQAWHARSSTR